MIHLNKSKVLVIGSTDRLRRRVASLLGELPGVFTSQRAGCAEIELYLAEHRIDAVLLEAAGGFLEDMERIHQTKPAMPIVAYDDDPGYAATRSALLNGAVDVLRIRSATAPVIEPVLRRALDPISHTFAGGLRHREQSIRAISRRGENFSQRLVSGDPPQFYMNGNRAMLLRANVLCTGSGLLWRQDAAWAWIQEFGVTNTFLFPSSGSELHLGAIVEQDYINATSYKHMLNGLSEGIIAIDHEGQITHVNPAIARMFEQKKIALGLPDARMKHVPNQDVWRDFDAVIASGQPASRNFTYREMTIRLTITPIVDEIGAIAGAVGLFSDITQSERLERTRREYVSNVSHELRTPLTAVRALIEPLKEGLVTEESDRMRYYDIILREVMRLSRLINDQLELSRLQSGGVAIQKQRMALDDLIYDVCDRYHSIAEEHGLELKIESDLQNCPAVYGNPDRVEQMLIILLDNAIKYTESGSVSVKVDWDDQRALITVRDTGIGIAEEDLPHVFERFYKVDKAHSGKGSGLGLSIARELLKRMDEEIWVESTRGEGSAFTFTVHRQPRQEAAS